MQLVDEIFKSFKEYHRLDDLKKLYSRGERFETIRTIVAGVNVFKAAIPANAVNRIKLPVSFILD
jgi:hypothetical protein